jgi:hypothetical protein
MNRSAAYRMVWLLLAGASVASAALVVTEQPSSYELRDAASHPISNGYKTSAECFAAAPGPGRYRCVLVVIGDVVGQCDAVPPPPPVVNADGFIERGDYAPHECPDNHYSFTQTQPVRDPFPSCAWVDKPVPVTDCEGRQIAPLLEGHGSTAQTDETPGPWIEGVDYPMGAACPAEALGGCYPSPNTPKDPPPGCVSEFCVPG